jgi:hypothetical protein
MIMFDGTVEINLGVLRLPGFYKQRDNKFCEPLILAPSLSAHTTPKAS